MANGKNKKKHRNVEILWPKKTWRKIVGDPFWDGGKKKKRGSVPGRPRRFLPPITPLKERCKNVHIAEYGSSQKNKKYIYLVGSFTISAQGALRRPATGWRRLSGYKKGCGVVVEWLWSGSAVADRGC